MRSTSIRTWSIALGLTLAAAASTPAMAAPEEIQVYMDEMSKQGEFGLDVHNNYVTQGPAVADYPGGLPSLHTYRVTPEFAYGITDNLEAGLYILSALNPQGGYSIGGEKLRLKFIAPKHSENQDWWWGLNFELGRLNRYYDINPSNAELKGIYGFRKGPWTVAFNANIDWTAVGPQPTGAVYDFDTKLSYKVADKWRLGIESYNGLGDYHSFGDLGHSEELLYAVADTSFGDWDLNAGVGHGLTRVGDQWVFKFILGVPIDNLIHPKAHKSE
jgi:hypothetical protein